MIKPYNEEADSIFNYYRFNRFNLSGFRLNMFELTNFIELSNYVQIKRGNLTLSFPNDAEYLAAVIILSYRALWWNLYVRYSHIKYHPKYDFVLEYEPTELFRYVPELEEKIRKTTSKELRPYIRFVFQSRSANKIIRGAFKRLVRTKPYEYYLNYMKQHPFLLPFKVFLLGESYFFFKGNLILTPGFIPNTSKDFFYNLYSATYTVYTGVETNPENLFCFCPSERFLDLYVEKVKLDLPKKDVLIFNKFGMLPLIEDENNIYLPFSVNTLISPKPFLVDLKNKWCFSLNNIGYSTLRNYWKIPKDKLREYDIQNLNVFNRYLKAPITRDYLFD
jgi:hypothetical protein